MTWKLKARVPTTAIITSGTASTGVAPDVAQPLPDLALAPGRATGDGRSSSVRMSHRPISTAT